jgi:regulator of sigma E protease
MTVVIFIAVLVVLIVVHEFGHFVVAKLSGMRVDEFGIGYPPRLIGFTYGETEYTLNALPFGGFVKIYGEDEPELKDGVTGRAFGAKPRILQAATLVAGIAMNLLLAYVLITATLLMGTPQALTAEQLTTAKDVQLIIAEVMPGSPAETAGIKAGDAIVSVSGNKTQFSGTDGTAFSAYMSSDTTKTPLEFSLIRNGNPLTLTATPMTGVTGADPTRPVLGVSVAPVGIIPVSWTQAPLQSAELTWEVTKETTVALVQFFGNIVTFKANLADVSGPIGIAGAVGGAAHQGLAALLSISAIISINLAVINLLPIPALDGGRLVFVLIEAITRKPIKSSVAQAINGVSFILLVILMIVVSGHDILVQYIR